MLVHALTLGVSLDQLIATALLGTRLRRRSSLLTGRIWGAILVHVVFNATFVAAGTGGQLPSMTALLTVNML